MPGRGSLIYIVEAPLTARDRSRFGIDNLLLRGFSISVIEIGAFMYPHQSFVRTHYNSFYDIAIHVPVTTAQLKECWELIEAAELVIFMAESNGIVSGNFAALRMVSATKTPYLIYGAPLPPGASLNNVRHRVARNPLRAFHHLTNLNCKNFLFARVPPALIGIRQAEYYADSAPAARRLKRLAGPKTHPIACCSPDYAIYRDAQARARTTRNQAVFLDQYLPFHPDFRDSKTPVPAPEAYYGTLNIFFERIESELGLEVVIAAHPRADYNTHADLINHRRVVKGQTAELVIQSQLVLAHGSTAIGFAALAEKPLFILSTMQLDRVGIEGLLYKAFSQELGCPIIYMDEAPSDIRYLMSIDRAKYAAYVDRYLRPEAAREKFLWDVIFDILHARGCRPSMAVEITDDQTYEAMGK